MLPICLLRGHAVAQLTSLCLTTKCEVGLVQVYLGWISSVIGQRNKCNFKYQGKDFTMGPADRLCVRSTFQSMCYT
jgi:hypothetical protein